ncbi:MAG: tricarboxylate binding receptor, partial [Xanthobacteraceae bacterium]|nr:tricarboxylate binding receptor [Xanthobacteraceae bacterium]
VQMNSGVLAPAHAHIKAGTIKALAVTGEKRWHDLPEVPTMLDAGYKDFVFATNCCFMAPAKTPPELVARIEKESLAVLARPEMQEKLMKSGFEIQAKNGQALGERVNKEIIVFKEVIEKAGITKI